MSVSTKNQPNTVGGGGGTGGDDDQDDGVGAVLGGGSCKETDDSEEEDDHDKDFGKSKGKRVSCFRFRKVRLMVLRRKRKGVSGNSARRRELSGGGGGCYLCLKRPLTSDSGGESQTSDPNSPNFTYEMLRVFIEKNDFYSSECNPHLDVESKPCSNQDDK